MEKLRSASSTCIYTILGYASHCFIYVSCFVEHVTTVNPITLGPCASELEFFIGSYSAALYYSSPMHTKMCLLCYLKTEF